MLYRIGFACLGFLPFAPGLRRLRRESVPLVLAAGVIGVAALFLIQFAGLALTSVAHASLMVGAAPVLIAVGGVYFEGEHLSAAGWTALIVSAAGAVLIATGASGRGGGGEHASVAGDGLVLASLLCAIVWVLASKRLMFPPHGYAPSLVSAASFLAGFVPIAGWVLALHGFPPVHLAARTWLALAAAGLISTTAATLLWNWGVARVPASRAGAFVNLEPVVGTLLGVALLGDSLGWPGLAGGAMVLGAAAYMTLPGRTGSGRKV